MIKVDISNIWGQVSLPNLLALEKEVASAHASLLDGTGPGGDLLGWLNLPVRNATKEISRIQAAAQKIRSDSDVFVVVGIGGSYLGARAAIDLVQGPNRNIGKGKSDPQIYYAGNSMSTRQWNELCRLLDGKDFSIAIISKSGTTTEPAIATRNLRRLLINKYGIAGANARTYAVTDPIKGALRQMATDNGWESFVIPTNVGGRYSVLSPVGLLPMAVAGIDILEVLNGAADAKEQYDNLHSLENPVWLYAAARNLLYRSGKAIELFAGFDPGFQVFGSWWQHLFAESEGKKELGLFPVTAEFTSDLHSIGQIIQQGQRNLFETMVRFDPPEKQLLIEDDGDASDGLNFLNGKTLDYIEEQAFLGTIDAHVDGRVPVITIDGGTLDHRKIGELFYFFELACALSGYVLGVNPFNQPGVSLYKQNMYRLLGRPGYENL